ncbi:RAD51-associated protein 1, partial [Ascaphus truei]|uniref:RAD51-associated protein 1 n=1 Tax=Ascaphus truei TaxID=8439 RepID=UPI003F5AA813
LSPFLTDQDFAVSSAPPSKKARLEIKKREKPERKPQKETVSQRTAQEKRIPLDDKLYQRDLEVALASSVQKTSAHVGSGGDAHDKGVPTVTDCETEDLDVVPLSNCRVDSNVLGLDEITDYTEEQIDGGRCRRTASKASTGHRKLLVGDGSGEEGADEFKPDITAYEDSESTSCSSGEEEELEWKKPQKSKDNKGIHSVKGQRQIPKAKLNAAAGSGVSPPVSIKVKSQPAPVSSAGKQILALSPPVARKKPKWAPPASSGNVKLQLEGVAVRSPNHGLRLGLSRLARIKPLHPTAVNN